MRTPTKEDLQRLTPVESLPPNESEDTHTEPTIWPVLDDVQIAICKELAQGLPIYKVENLGKVFVVRPIRSREWNELLKQFAADAEGATIVHQDEAIAAFAVVWPQLPPSFWTETLAGHPATLSTTIRQHSGFPIILDDGTVVGEKINIETLVPLTFPDTPDPTSEQFDTWAKKVPGGMLSAATFETGYKFVYGAIPRAVWKSIQSRLEKGQEVDAPLEIVQNGAVWSNVPVGDVPAGYIDAVSSQILKASGFNMEPIVSEL